MHLVAKIERVSHCFSNLSVLLVVQIIGGEKPWAKPLIIWPSEGVLAGQAGQVDVVLQQDYVTNLITEIPLVFTRNNKGIMFVSYGH